MNICLFRPNTIYYLLIILLISQCLTGYTNCNTQDYYLGTGIADITGPAAEQGMMGYGQVKQRTTGIYQRLWARAFVIASPCNGKRIILVNADLGHIFQGIKQAVIDKLQEKYSEYSTANVVLAATHQHSGPGGYSTYAFYNLTTLGFDRQYFNTIVDGIVAAIDYANSHLQPGTISINQGILSGITINRSPLAYANNPLSEQQRYLSNVDVNMTQLRFNNISGEAIGVFNWFPIHGTSMNNRNTLINGDNKGYAAYLLEQDFNRHHPDHTFVAGFAQANSGDVSPNVHGKDGGNNESGLNSIAQAAIPQYKMAKQLLNAPQESISGPIDYRHVFLAMDHIIIEATDFTDEQVHSTCTASIGLPMLGGTSDGKGIDLNDKYLQKFLDLFTSQTHCQGEKQIIVETGSKLPYPWTPNILPLQLIQIGNLAIIATPFELTTMAGRRLADSMAGELSKIGINYIVLTTLANAYAGYVTTREEYQLQEYEGASNHFGPWSLAALQQEFLKLAQALTQNVSLPPGPTPPNLLDLIHININPKVLFDDTPPGKYFGALHEDPTFAFGVLTKSRYHIGEKVMVKFWGANPRNNYRNNNTFLAIQHFTQDSWHTILTDNDWDTEYMWERHGIANSIITISWRIAADTIPGLYRIKHYGDYKSFWAKKTRTYEGTSRQFLVLN